jgi:trehalose 6-phosphate synthase/phosphatase
MNRKWDFILAIGDDYTDEDLFDGLSEKAYTIKVGLDTTNAKYYVASQVNIRKLLNKMVTG